MLLYQNHDTVRHAYEMSQAQGPQQSDYQGWLNTTLAKMREHIKEGQPVIITHCDPASNQIPNLDETALVLKTEEELDLYQTMLGQPSKTLDQSMHNAKLLQALLRT